jgi:hypothetical protein
MVHHETFAGHEQARAEISDEIETFYNKTRLHSSLGYQRPEAFEAVLRGKRYTAPASGPRRRTSVEYQSPVGLHAEGHTDEAQS